MTGARPSRAAATSRTARAITFTELSGRIARAEATPSVNGPWAMTAATAGSRAAVARTWPPPNEVPHSTTRRGSASGRERGQATAAVQS